MHKSLKMHSKIFYKSLKKVIMRSSEFIRFWLSSSVYWMTDIYMEKKTSKEAPLLYAQAFL